MEASGVGEEVKLSLKLMIHKETNKVLFADVEKDFVDVLISFLTLPLGTIARLVAKECDMGPIKIASLSSLYESVVNLDDKYMSTDTCKEMLLQPRNSMEDYCRSLKFNVDDTEPTKYYACDNLVHFQNEPKVMCSTFKNIKCCCGKLMDHQIWPNRCITFDGFVNNVSCFIVTDDLCLHPMSLDTKLSIIRKMAIEDISSMKEIVVDVTKNKLIDLLKCSLVSKTPLTDVFLRKKFTLQKYDGKIYSEEQWLQCTLMKVNAICKKSDGKVVCVQGNADFANFLFTTLTFPLGGSVHLLGDYSSIGSIDGLYKSVVDLSEDYFNTKELKAKLVEDNFTNLYLDTKYLFLDIDGTCKTLEMVYPNSEKENSERFIREGTFYVATDNLVVSPISSVSLISLINTINTTTLFDIEEKEFSIGFREVLYILKALLTSSSALTESLYHFVK